MIVESCSFTVHFPNNQKIREKFFLLEKHFEGFQKPFTLMPVPEDAPIEIPRIIAMTEKQHSQLIITGNTAQISTNFDENYNKDISKCISYVKDKSSSIITSIPLFGAEIDGKPKFYFSGLTINSMFTEEDGIYNPSNYISENFINCKSNLNLDENQFRVTYIVDEKYYVNLTVQNAYQFTTGPDERGSFVNSGEPCRYLQVIMDINDRYAFNHSKNYLSSEDTASKVIELAEKFSKDYLGKFIRDGEILYDVD